MSRAAGPLLCSTRYQVSIEQDENSEGYKAAMDLVQAAHAAHLRGDLKRQEGDRLLRRRGHAGCKDESVMRYVPFNGGLGNKQREWLTD